MRVFKHLVGFIRIQIGKTKNFLPTAEKKLPLKSDKFNYY